MSKLTNDEKTKVRNFMAASLPDLENVCKHITQCRLAPDKIVSILMTGDGYISIDFYEFSGASAYRGDIGGPVKLKFEETETLEAQR